MDIYGYNKEADDIDEIQAEDRQERMKREKAKHREIKYKLHTESMNETYGDDSEHKCCDKCGMCIECNDCTCYHGRSSK